MSAPQIANTVIKRTDFSFLPPPSSSSDEDDDADDENQSDDSSQRLIEIVRDDNHLNRCAITCTICCKLFTRADQYDHHMQNFHSPDQSTNDFKSLPTAFDQDFRDSTCSPEDRPVPCLLCNESFYTLFELESHRSQEHENLVLFECTNCLRKCEVPGDTQCTICPNCNHLRDPFLEPTVTIQKDQQTGPIICPRCDDIFLSKIVLRDHQIAEHPAYYSPYVCRHRTKGKNKCKLKFYTYDEFIRHLEQHKLKYVCNYCDKSFTMLNTLRQHIRVHTGEKPFQCTVCGRMFSVKDYLTKHLRVHTGEKPYACDLDCGARFTQKSAQRLHMKNSCPHRFGGGKKSKIIVKLPLRTSENDTSPTDESSNDDNMPINKLRRRNRKTKA